MDDKTIKQKLVVLTKFWTSQNGYEKGQTQQFWNSILRCFDDSINLSQSIVYEKQVVDPETNNTHFIDAYIPKTRVLIEQKSSRVAIDKPEQQSDGTKLTPFQQASRYDNWLPLVEKSRYIVCSNFKIIEIHDRNRPLEPPTMIPFTEEGIEKNFFRLKFLLEPESTVSALEIAVSKMAAQLIGNLYEDILKLYKKDEINEDLFHIINVFCVRLVFCFYAEDALIFRRKDMFGQYMKQFNKNRDEFRLHLKLLFQILNTPLHNRDSEDIALNEFPFANGGLFDKETPLPRLSEDIAFKITQKISLGFDWSPINPAIFGAMFESTLSSVARREGGMHYTTTDNIDKAVGTLFLNNLRKELAKIVEIKDLDTKIKQLFDFQDKISKIKVLDPACGSGNFLTHTYMELRRLENKVLYELKSCGVEIPNNPIKVSLSQFYGFEIYEFAVDTAKTALWISQNQMLQETIEILGQQLPELPLTTINTIHHVNALEIKWEDYVSPAKINYITGNPPFVGYSWQSKRQKQEVLNIFGKDWKNVGKIDYVTCWYKKAYDYISENSTIQCAFVSTNSICQGEQVSSFWKPLITNGLKINFAYSDFKWESDSTDMARVHCIIIGFSLLDNDDKIIISEDGKINNAKHINAYLMDFPDVYVEPQRKPICDVPEMQNGGKPAEGGFLILTESEKEEILKENPCIKKFLRPYMMGKDFIMRKPRWCLWLVDAKPNEIKSCPEVFNRVKQVREYRLKSKKKSTQQKAETPMLFDEIRECFSDYIAIPKVSSERRKYIPIDFLSKEIIPGDKLFMIQNADLYTFGIITSIVHMAWMRFSCGRLEVDYSYSNTIVYNNFVWPNVSEKQKEKISKLSQKIIDIRLKYKESTFAELYDNVLMPKDLRAAHNDLDKAVLALYNLPSNASEYEMVKKIFSMLT